MTQPASTPLHGITHGKWLFCLTLSLLITLVGCWSKGLVYLNYDRTALMQGELWRILTAHVVHLNWPHLFLNLCGLILIVELLWGQFPLWHGFGLLLFSGVTISACLWWLHPELVGYAGFSGILHGLWAGCAIYGLLSIKTASLHSISPYLIGLILLIIKLFIEQYYGPSAMTAQLIGGKISIESHLYGSFAGAVYVLMLGCVRMQHLFRGALQQG